MILGSVKSIKSRTLCLMEIRPFHSDGILRDGLSVCGEHFY